jgi:hypothetical protein
MRDPVYPTCQCYFGTRGGFFGGAGGLCLPLTLLRVRCGCRTAAGHADQEGGEHVELQGHPSPWTSILGRLNMNIHTSKKASDCNLKSFYFSRYDNIVLSVPLPVLFLTNYLEVSSLEK